MLKIDANQLRWLAEAADGIRDEPAALVRRADGSLDVVRDSERTARDTVVLELETASRGPGVDGSAEVRIFWNGRIYDPKVRLPDGRKERVDALFVTQSAIQKFLLPYYMRFRSGAEVQAVENKLFNDRHVKAAIHIPPSHAGGFSAIYAVSPDPESENCLCE